MTHLRQKLRTWCLNRFGENDQTLHRAWFYIGNNPKLEPAQYLINGHQIRTVIAPSDDPEEPNCWAMEVIHGDWEVSARHWSAEATLRKDPGGCIRFTTVIKHWMIPYFIGEYPDPPPPSTPFYVRSMLDDAALECRRGGAILESRPVNVSQDMVHGVFQKLTSPNRHVPFVLIASDSNGILAVDPVGITKPIIANANVFVLTTASVVDEMNYYLGDQFRCELGSLRVYVPNLDRANPDNARLHRYLSPAFIQDHGRDEVVRFLANGLSRNGRTFRVGDLTTFDDIFSERRKYVIKKLADEHREMREESRMAWDMNTQLAHQHVEKAEEAEMVWEENEKLATEASTWEALAIQHESENEQLQRELSGLKYRIEEAERVRSRIADLESQVQGLGGMTTLPRNLAEALECMTKLFPRRIACTTGALSAATEYSSEHDCYWCKSDQLAIAWEMLFVAATCLYDLVFVEKVHDLEAAFKGRCNFELAMSEGRQTKKDGDLMRLRKVTHNGREFDITPHLKYGSRKPKMLRLHFAIDREASCLVIGHLGDHMENYSTQKL
jgi:hypothetical protein